MRSTARLFIASSTEGLDAAYALQENLEFDCDPTVWSQGVFQPSSTTLSDLIEEASRSDFAAFMFTPDDIVRMRGGTHPAVRDNVIFELGLFIGRLGRSRCFHVVPHDQQPLRLPSDLVGIAPLSYNGQRADGRLVAALGPASNQIRRAIRSLGLSQKNGPGDEAAGLSEMIRPDFERLWESEPLKSSRLLLRPGLVAHYDDGYAEQRPHVERVFAFLESMADAVISGSVAEEDMRRAFGQAVLSFWPPASVALAPLNDARGWWDPLPKLGELFQRWTLRQDREGA